MIEPDDTTPPERPPIGRPRHHAGLVRALTNHVVAEQALLAHLVVIRDGIAALSHPLPVADLRDIADRFRAAGDSAHDVAREAERDARSVR